MPSKLQQNRILILSALMAAIVAIGMSTPKVLKMLNDKEQERITRPSPRLASDLQQIELLQTLLKTYKYEGRPLPPPEPGDKPRTERNVPIVLLDSTISFCADESTVAGKTAPCQGDSHAELLLIPEINAQIPLKLRQELVLANEKSVKVTNPKMANVLFESRESVEKLFTSGGWWNDFYAKFPGTAGTLSVSQAVISQDGTYALIYADNHCDGTCGTGTLHYFKRTDETWKLIASVGLWIS